MATFLVSSIVYLTTYLKKDLTLKIFDQDITGFTKDIFSIILIISLPYFFLLIFALLYSLVIGRASVVSSAPLALLSLLPSILISIAAWVMKSTILKNGNERKDKNDDWKNEIDGRNSKQPKETDTNEDGLVTANAMPVQNEGSKENEGEESNQDGSNTAMLIQDGERHGREEIKEASRDREEIAITKQLQQKEESCGRDEIELSIVTKV